MAGADMLNSLSSLKEKRNGLLPLFSAAGEWGVPIGLVLSILGALLIYHGSGLTQTIGYILIWLLILASVKLPGIGLVSLFPCLYILPSAPIQIGLPEVTYASLIGLFCLRTLIVQRHQLAVFLCDRRSILLWISLLFALSNLVVALGNGIEYTDWVRGLVPFLFILPAIPFYLVLRDDTRLQTFFVWSIAAASTLFAGRVVFVYVERALWKPVWYLFESGNWHVVPYEEVLIRGTEGLSPFVTRVTLVLQQSTDVLVPIGIVWGFCGYLLGSSRTIRLLSLLLAALSTIAVTMTYTRSMLLSAVVVVSLLSIFLLVYFGRSLTSRIISIIGILGLVFLTTVFTLNLENIYLNRLFQLTDAVKVIWINHMGSVSGAMDWWPGDGPNNAPPLSSEATTNDENVTARLEEIKIAWKMFTESPLLGNGLGVKHTMKFAGGFGVILEQEVAYVHNWILYMLMTGGLMGLIWYSLVALTPSLLLINRTNLLMTAKIALFSTAIFMMLYALFFAVFRLLPFNLLLAACWGYLLSREHQEE